MDKYIPIPVSAARELAERFEKSIIIINAWDPVHGLLHTTTYGRNKQECEWAATGGDIACKALGGDLNQWVVHEDFRKSKLLKALASWINGNVGASSTALYLYMAVGYRPFPFDAPSDDDDRRRCMELLKAVPEWIPRLAEIEKLGIVGTRNGEEVMPWNEQIPLIRKMLEK